MVASAHSRLLARKASNIENAAPGSAAPAPKRPRTIVSGAVAEVSRRKRPARPSGVRTPRYMVEQAKRRVQAQSSQPEKLSIVVSASDADVLMRDAAAAPSSRARRVQIPRTLGRPDFKEVSSEVLASVDPDLAKTPADYIRDALEEIGPRYVSCSHCHFLIVRELTGVHSMMQVLRSVVAKAPTNINAIPSTLDVSVGDNGHDAPTHMLAVYTPGTQPLSVKLYPVHGAILAAHCASIAPFPASHPSPPATPDEPLTLPVVPLNLPHAESYPLLSAFLYTRRADSLMASLMPSPPPAATAGEAGDILLRRYARVIAATFTSRAIYQRLQTVYGLWANACRLGVFEHGLWMAIDQCWEVLLTALAISVGKPEMMIPTQSA